MPPLPELWAYRAALTLLTPVLLGRLGLRVLRGTERRADLDQRLGAPPPVAGRWLWLHGASNGELTSARALIATLRAAHPALPLVVTCNTRAARQMVAGWGDAGVVARLAPLDLRACLGRFLHRGAPLGLIVIENELWPNRLGLLAARGVPVAVVSARLSPRSAARWGRFGRLARQLLGGLALLSAQDRQSAARLAALGLPEDRQGPVLSLKETIAAEAPDPAALAAFGGQFRREATLLAASTHPGEEEAVIAAFLAARKARPDLRMILAPRHPDRGPAVSALLHAAGLAHARRATGALPAPQDPVYLADTLGEMALWYAQAGCCFIGGSLVDKGGHTPHEPAAAACALLHGPHVGNFTDSYARLAAHGAAHQVADGAGLGRVLAGLDADGQARLGELARETLAARADPGPLCAALERALGLGAPPLSPAGTGPPAAPARAGDPAGR